jgi:predicted NUDIX family NTP pyrophosphohydrolase
MPRLSAGLLLYRIDSCGPKVLLVHPGGPFFRNRDDGAWSIPKGEVEPGEELLAAAVREFQEEIGVAPEGPFLPLIPVKQRGGKVVHAWAFAGDCDLGTLGSSTFTMEWPPRSGKQATFPEIDRAEFFDLESARRKINLGQIPLIDELGRLIEAME